MEQWRRKSKISFVLKALYERPQTHFIIYFLNQSILPFQVLCAIAIPLSIPDRNIFMSYNYEANYNNPTSPADSVPGPMGVKIPGRVRTSQKHFNSILSINKKFFQFDFTQTKTTVDPFADVPFVDEAGRKLQETNGMSTESNEIEVASEKSQKLKKYEKLMITRKNVYRAIERRINEYVIVDLFFKFPH